MVRDLEQISRNSYILMGVIEILRQNDVYLITTECDLNTELINSCLLYTSYQAWRNGGKIIQKFKQSGNGVRSC